MELTFDGSFYDRSVNFLISKLRSLNDMLNDKLTANKYETFLYSKISLYFISKHDLDVDALSI